MLKKLKNEKGSALTYVLIIMMLLSILGLALISSTVINFKVNRQTGSFNKSFYITDGAIDETLAELKEITFRAEADASDWITDAESEFRNEDKWIKFYSNINNRLESGELTSERVVELTEIALKREYTKKYYEFLLEVPNVNDSDSNEIFVKDYMLYNEDGIFIEDYRMNLKSTVVLKTEYSDALINVSFAPASAATGTSDNYNSASINDIELTQTVIGDYITLDIESSGAYNNNNKKIAVQLDIIIPNYNYIVSTMSKNKPIHINEALENAILARGDFAIAGGEVIVNGDIYAYGQFPEKEEYLYSELGGILVGVDDDNLSAVFNSIGVIDYDKMGATNIKGQLEVDGDIKTRSSIRINGDNSSLSSTGDMYANSFVVDKGSDAITASTDMNLYMMEDMILFGDDSSINIGKSNDIDNGEIWTFLEGSPSGTNRNIRDLSGSIIIDNNSENLRLISNKYFISGVSYIDLYRNVTDIVGTYKQYYQSGESFTTNNYNKYYTRKIASTDKTTKYVDYTIASGPDIDETIGLVETVKENAATGIDEIVQDVNYKAIHFITKNDEVTSGYEKFFGSNSISERDRSIFEVNSLPSVNNDRKNEKNNYALGVVLANNTIINPYQIDNGDDDSFANMSANDFEEKRKENVEKLDKEVSLLATRKFLAQRDDDNKFNAYDKFDDLFLLNEDTNQSNLIDDSNFLFINNDKDRDIYINLPNSIANQVNSEDTSAVIIQFDEERMNKTGAIITKGNIIIYNESETDFVFNGPLISEKNILMYGSGKKIINNMSTEDSYSDDLIRLLATNQKLFDATNSATGREVSVKDVEGTSTPTRSIDGNLTVDIINNSETINTTVNSNTILEGIIKTDQAKTIIINSWREID